MLGWLIGKGIAKVIDKTRTEPIERKFCLCVIDAAEREDGAAFEALAKSGYGPKDLWVLLNKHFAEHPVTLSLGHELAIRGQLPAEKKDDGWKTAATIAGGFILGSLLS